MSAHIDDIGRRLLEEAYGRGLRIASAESCTGGRIASALTATAGASATFASGIVSYSDEIKSRVLGVDKSLIERHTAVSREVAIEMARCARVLMRADLGIATTGYLGPEGGADGTPAGVVYIGLSYLGDETYHRLELGGTRLANAEEATRWALLLALELITR